jgi:putative ABC transport system permease protein
VGALALGIGGTTVMYSAVHGLLLQPLPYAEADRLVQLRARWGNGGEGSVSWPDFQDWRAQSKTVELLSGMTPESYTLVKDGRGERILAAHVTADFFALLGVQPALGRGFSKESFVDGRELLLSHEVWQRSFGGAGDVLGRTVRLSDKSFVVVGVLPASYRLPSFAGGIYLPLVGSEHPSRGNHFMDVIGRYAPGATPAQASAEFDTISRALAASFPDSNKDRSVGIRSWQESITARLRPALLLLFGAVLLFLVMACANVANMLLARATARRAELALRLALGASRARIVRQMMTECLLLGLLGGVAGLILSTWGIEAIAAVTPRRFIFDAHLDGHALLFAAGVALGSTLVFGLVPALRAVHDQPATVLKEDGPTMSSGRSRLRATLVVLQVAVSFALLVGATLLGRSFLGVAHVEPGFDPTGVVTLQMSLPHSKDAAVFYRQVLERVQALPGVRVAGLVNFLPLSSNNVNGGFEIEGKQLDDPNRTTEYMIASDGYFDVMGMRVVRGRGFVAGDGATTQPVCIVNQRMARKYFGTDDPVGRHMRTDWPEDKGWLTVVGVVGDIHRFGLDSDAQPETYLPLAQHPFAHLALAVRGSGGAALAAAVGRAVASVDPEQAAFDPGSMAEAVADSLKPRRLLLGFSTFLGAVALTLATIGLWGVLALEIAQRTRELGIRMALGARPEQVRLMLVRRGVLLALAGAVAGSAAALALSSLLGTLLFGVAATDPLTYAAVAAGLVAVAMVASWLPARRVLALDLMVALRG